MALLALDALRPLPVAKRADDATADEEEHEVVVAGIREESVEGEKAWLPHPCKSRTEQTAGAADDATSLIST